MKDCSGHAGMVSKVGFASGASCLNLSCGKQDKQSAITLFTPTMWTIHILMLYLAAQ